MFRILYGTDILAAKAQAIVLPANPKPKAGNGLDKYIYSKAGFKKLLNARKQIGKLGIAECGITEGFDIGGKIIHVVTPYYYHRDSDMQLYNCYKNALETARDNGIRTVAFPLLSAGRMGFPAEEALYIAQDALDTSEYEGIFDELLLVVRESIGDDDDDDNYCNYSPEQLEEMKVIAPFEAKEREEAINKMYQQMKNDLSVKEEFERRKREYIKRQAADEYSYNREFVKGLIDSRIGEGKLYKSLSELASKCCEYSTMKKMYDGDRGCSPRVARKLALHLHLNRRDTLMLMQAFGIEFPAKNYRSIQNDKTNYIIYDKALLDCIEKRIYDEVKVSELYNRRIEKGYEK